MESSKGIGAMSIIAFVLVVVGGLNWGLVGLFEFNLVTYLFGEGSALSRLVFVLVGLSAVYLAAAVPMMLRRGIPQAVQPTR